MRSRVSNCSMTGRSVMGPAMGCTSKCLIYGLVGGKRPRDIVTLTRVYHGNRVQYLPHVGHGRIGHFIWRARFHDAVTPPFYPDRFHANSFRGIISLSRRSPIMIDSDAIVPAFARTVSKNR